MRLNEAREFYYFHTGKTSEIVRQLALAGIAVIWIFKVGQTQIPPELLLPLYLIAATLVLDFFQYFVAATIWGVFSRHKENVCEKEEKQKDMEQTPKLPPLYKRLRGGVRSLNGGIDSRASAQPAKSAGGQFEFIAPRELNWPAIAFFYMKAASLVTSYWFLFDFIYPKILK